MRLDGQRKALQKGLEKASQKGKQKALQKGLFPVEHSAQAPAWCRPCKRALFRHTLHVVGCKMPHATGSHWFVHSTASWHLWSCGVGLPWKGNNYHCSSNLAQHNFSLFFFEKLGLAQGLFSPLALNKGNKGLEKGLMASSSGNGKRNKTPKPSWADMVTGEKPKKETTKDEPMEEEEWWQRDWKKKGQSWDRAGTVLGQQQQWGWHYSMPWGYHAGGLHLFDCMFENHLGFWMFIFCLGSCVLDFLASNHSCVLEPFGVGGVVRSGGLSPAAAPNSWHWQCRQQCQGHTVQAAPSCTCPSSCTCPCCSPSSQQHWEQSWRKRTVSGIYLCPQAKFKNMFFFLNKGWVPQLYVVFLVGYPQVSKINVFKYCFLWNLQRTKGGVEEGWLAEAKGKASPHCWQWWLGNSAETQEEEEEEARLKDFLSGIGGGRPCKRAFQSWQLIKKIWALRKGFKKTMGLEKGIPKKTLQQWRSCKRAWALQKGSIFFCTAHWKNKQISRRQANISWKKNGGTGDGKKT